MGESGSDRLSRDVAAFELTPKISLASRVFSSNSAVVDQIVVDHVRERSLAWIH